MQFNYRNIIPLLGKLIYQPRDPERKRKLSARGRMDYFQLFSEEPQEDDHSIKAINHHVSFLRKKNTRKK